MENDGLVATQISAFSKYLEGVQEIECDLGSSSEYMGKVLYWKTYLNLVDGKKIFWFKEVPGAKQISSGLRYVENVGMPVLNFGESYSN